MSSEARVRRPLWVDVTFMAVAFIVFAVLMGLGVWQTQRLAWKTNLIDAVESRAFGAPVDPPASPVSADRHAYLRIVVTGTFRDELTRRVKAVTDLGPGEWVLTPLRTADGHTWINRGFAPPRSADKELEVLVGPIDVQGLLRMTEPDGTLLEQNDPLNDRWVSRDIAALSLDAGLDDAADYFIDADHIGKSDAWPRGGLTKVRFRNSHLSYALTWFTMAALFLGGMAYVVYDRVRQPDDQDKEDTL